MQNSMEILYIILAVMVFVLICLVTIFMVLKIKAKNQKKDQNEEENDKGTFNKTKAQQKYEMKSIFDFMEFDKIEDNMIIQKKGKRFLMIVKCQGVNYDLMSDVEKTSVEQGFIQYLNTLRYPIQIYVQTKTVDLGDSIKTYKEKVKVLGDKLNQKEFDYNQKIRSNIYDKSALEKERFEVTKARNLYEYGIDIVNNTERMSLNRNILSKQYYIIIPYYPEELNSENYAKEEISNAAFSELYTRAQSTISLLSVCGINGKILDSFELASLLYTAYNRDESEVYDLQKAINSGFDEMYITAPDVLDKRMKALDEEIEKEAIRKANEAAMEAKVESDKEKAVRKKEEEFSELIAKMSKFILENNKSILGKEVVDRAKEKIEKGERKDEKEQNKKTGRTKRAI